MNDRDQWGRPANKGRFQKGRSGNPRGRPRKVERAWTTRQLRHDLLNLMDEPCEITINGKQRKISAIDGVYWRMMQLALGGDKQMMLEVVKLRQLLLIEHYHANQKVLTELDSHEQQVAHGEDAVRYDAVAMEFLNRMRRISRKL